MKARPMLFAGPMVRAQLEGRKTMTRRAIKGVPSHMHCGRDIMDWDLSGIHQEEYLNDHGLEASDRWYLDAQTEVGDHSREVIRCPYGQPGDLLWLRETWAEGWTYAGERPAVFYRSTMDGLSHCQHALNYDRVLGASAPSDGIRWRPSIHMPRWASRLTLRITDVRVERLQDISEADALAEGIHKPFGSQFWHSDVHGSSLPGDTPIWAFRNLWESINGDGSWAANPWVWRIEFAVIRKNVDDVMRGAA